LEYNQRYKKYQWIRLELIRYTADPRPESYKPVRYDKIELGGLVSTARAWHQRRKLILRKVYTNFSHLINEAKNKKICTSLAVFKPTKIVKFIIDPVAREWDKRKLAFLKAKADQTNLFAHSDNPFEVVSKIPYKYSYEFVDDTGSLRTLMIIDWEIGQLYWNCLKRTNNEAKACNDVKRKKF